MCDNADQVWDTIADEMVDVQRQIDNRVQTLTVKQAE
jgi:hypothetical protein